MTTTYRQPIASNHFVDDAGNPTGGNSYGVGFAISWQTGLIADDGHRNGAFVEEVLLAVRDRLDFYQRTRFACEHNEAAVQLIDLTLTALAERTKDREGRGVEGTHQL